MMAQVSSSCCFLFRYLYAEWTTENVQVMIIIYSEFKRLQSFKPEIDAYSGDLEIWGSHKYLISRISFTCKN